MSDGAALTVFLVRHAAHDRVDRILCGRMAGVSLGSVGRAQALGVAARLRRERVAAVISSPLERARETAEPIAAALGIEPQVCPELNEIDCGDWTGRSFDELRLDERWRDWNRDRETGRAPGGESMRAVQGRVATAMERWRSADPGGAVVAVSHSDVIKAAICGVLGLSVDRYGAFEIEPASITTLVLWQGGGKVLSLNETLRPDAAGEARKAAA